MTNLEFYKDEILKLAEETIHIAVTKTGLRPCAVTCCSYCLLRDGNKPCGYNRIKWFSEEYIERPKLNKHEKAFCEALQKGWIFRNKNGRLAFSTEKVSNQVRNINFDIFSMMRSYNNKIHFDFIKDGFDNQWSIEELLKLEVVNDG